MTKLAEIQQAIEQLPVEEQGKLWRWFLAHGVETPEMLAAIDEGVKSLETEPTIPAEEVRSKIKGWATR
jgi:hypothetical protein